MIIVKIIGGLGNQLFQYAFGMALAHNKGIKVYYDIEDFNEKYKLRKVALKHFNIEVNNASQKEIDRLQSIINKISFKIYSLSDGLLIKKNYLKYYIEKGSKFDKTAFLLSNDIYMNGYWQSEKYFIDIKELIKSKFSIITAPDTANLDMLYQIHNSNSVSIHVRRGDFISDPSSAKIYNACTMEYYENSIDYISERVETPIFYIFSDDKKWVKDRFKNKSNIIFVEHNDSESAYEDLRLMSNCKHNIIANSTFSWWGAWLNCNDDKIVVSPKEWFINNVRSITDLTPQNWISL